MFPASKIALHKGRTFVTTSAYTSIIDYITGTQLAEYVQEQNKWPDQVFHTKYQNKSRYVSTCTTGKTRDDKNKNLHNRLDLTRKTKKTKNSIYVLMPIFETIFETILRSAVQTDL